MPRKITEHRRWLGGHGLNRTDGPERVKLVEIVKGDWPVNEGDSVALFKYERKPIDDSEILRNLKLMACSWVDFRSLVRMIPEEALDWNPGRRFGRSIRRIIVHVALVEGWYIMKLRAPGDRIFRWPKGESMWPLLRRVDRESDISLETLDSLRASVAHRLAHLSDEEKRRITRHKPGEWTKRTVPEQWTARKVFRRFIWHEKLHAATIEKLLSIYNRENKR